MKKFYSVGSNLSVINPIVESLLLAKQILIENINDHVEQLNDNNLDQYNVLINDIKKARPQILTAKINSVEFFINKI